jgi:hypothetical protein
MHAASNTVTVTLGIVLLVALVVFLGWHIGRSTIGPSACGHGTRLAANDALRRRLQSKFPAGVRKRTHELERTPEGPRTRVGGRRCVREQA